MNSKYLLTKHLSDKEFIGKDSLKWNKFSIVSFLPNFFYIPGSKQIYIKGKHSSFQIPFVNCKSCVPYIITAN